MTLQAPEYLRLLKLVWDEKEGPRGVTRKNQDAVWQVGLTKVGVYYSQTWLVLRKDD